MSKAYILGALHDGTERKYTYRIGQKHREYVEAIAEMVRKMGGKAWVYREGKSRNLYIVEFSKSLLKGFCLRTRKDKLDYIAGYFDAEGSASEKKPWMYVYFAQKNKRDLTELKNYLLELGVRCGKTHNPSKREDPLYWRFFVLAESRKKFAGMIVSRHPVKSAVLRNLEMVI